MCSRNNSYSIVRLAQGMALMLGLLFSQMSAAFYYDFNVNNPYQNAAAGHIDSVNATYDPSAQNFGWDVTFSENNGYLPNGFWLVVSDGENPKNNVNEYSILYADTVNNVVSAYLYNGQNSSNSWNTPGEFIKTYQGVLNVVDSANTRTISMNLDVSDINNYTPANGDPNDWDGVSFDENIGVWFHPVNLVNVAYNPDNSLSAFSYNRSGWYDTANQNANTVSTPLPGGLLLFLVGGFAARCFLREKQESPLLV